MASVLGGADTAATSVGIPIRNMHTISELGHTGDVTACIHGVYAGLECMDAEGITAGDLVVSSQPHEATCITNVCAYLVLVSYQEDS